MDIIANPGDWARLKGPWRISSHARGALRERFSFDDARFHELEQNLIHERFVQVPERNPRDGSYILQTVVDGMSMFLPISFGDKLVITALAPFCIGFPGEILVGDAHHTLGDALRDDVKKSIVTKIEKRRRNMIVIDQTYYEVGEHRLETDQGHIVRFTKDKDAQRARDYLKWEGDVVKTGIGITIFESFDDFMKVHLKKIAADAMKKLSPAEVEAVEAFYADQFRE